MELVEKFNRIVEYEVDIESTKAALKTCKDEERKRLLKKDLDIFEWGIKKFKLDMTADEIEGVLELARIWGMKFKYFTKLRFTPKEIKKIRDFESAMDEIDEDFLKYLNETGQDIYPKPPKKQE